MNDFTAGVSKTDVLRAISGKVVKALDDHVNISRVANAYVFNGDISISVKVTSEEIIRCRNAEKKRCDEVEREKEIEREIRNQGFVPSFLNGWANKGNNDE